MKTRRQKKILDLITKTEIDTQEELQTRLNDAGFNVTQATISRDIRELGLIKTASASGKYKYSPNATKEKENITGKFSSILIQAAHSVDYARNLVIIKTYTGMGSAAGAAVDSMEMSGVIGSLAGDDTLLIITRDDETASRICENISNLIGKNK
ncbi:MAG: arginine repressor [Clostridiales bacterium GWF2_36_10]|nr:MAG: arginine repressor [Clostridiales bacterium GWF2_36_10]HAN22046.1 arginine repressor [Clostridiales bacterium]